MNDRKDGAVRIEAQPTHHLAGGQRAEIFEKFQREGDIRVGNAHFAARSASNLIDSPQPQASVTLGGLLNLKPLSSSPTS